MPKLKGLLYLVLLPFLGACSLDVSIDELGQWYPPHTKVISKNEAYADGRGVVVLQLQVFDQRKNTFSGLELDLKPGAFENTGLSSSGCTISDQNGYTTCRFRSTQSGEVAVELEENQKNKTFETDLNFLAIPPQQSWFNVSPSKIIEQEANGYSVMTNIRQVNQIETFQEGFEIQSESLNIDITGFSDYQ